MKKSFLCLVFSLLLLAYSPVFAATEIPVDVSKVSDLANISMTFCNEWFTGANSLSLKLQDNTSQDLCIELSNSAKVESIVALDFVDGSVTSNQNKACRKGSVTKMFWQYVTGFNKTVTIASWSSVMLTGSIKFPEWYAWEALGCVTYYIHKGASEWWINVISRKAHFIDILVDGNPISDFYMNMIKDTYLDTMGQNNSSNDYLWVFRLRDWLEVLYSFTNSWNIPQTVNFEVTTQWSFWYVLNFTGTQTVLPGETSLQKFWLAKTPRYVWSTDITLSWVAVATVPEWMSVWSDFTSEPLQFTQSTKIVLLTWVHLLFVWGILVVLYLIIFLLKRKKKKTEVTKK